VADPKPTPADESELRERAALILEAFERAEPDLDVAQLRTIVSRARGATALRGVLRELRGMQAGLPASARAGLRRAMAERFGPDPDWERDRQVVEKVRERGRVTSEREYRVVQGYADAIAGDVDAQDEILALGALLDAYMAAR
jgi:hypothetical protein